MENLTRAQAIILAKAIATSWDELPDVEEQEFGEKSEAKANQTIAAALEDDDVIAAGIKLSEEQLSDVRGQFHVYLEDASSWGDISRMEAELAELFAAE